MGGLRMADATSGSAGKKGRSGGAVVPPGKRVVTFCTGV
jgi:hypothetical protein